MKGKVARKFTHQVHGGHGDQEEEGRLHQRALVDRLAVEYGEPEREQDGGACAVHHRLVEQKPLAPPVTEEFPAITDGGRPTPILRGG